MRSPWIIAILLAAVGIGAYLLFGPTDGKRDDVAQRLKERQMRQSIEPVIEEEPETPVEPDWKALEAEGKGIPVPDGMRVAPGEDGTYWFVGVDEKSFGVEIPFGAGRFRTPPPEQEPVGDNPGYLGADACAECHKEKYDGFVHTAHHLTSRLPERDAFGGSFEEGKDVLPTQSPNVAFKMVERDGKFYQRVFFYGWQFEVPMDIIVGSGKLGQSYLFWHDNGLFQSNVSYATTTDCWANSPGYLDGDAKYSRLIRSRCVECHFTYADARDEENHFTPSSFIMGISCERCHGPGAEHVTYHGENKDDKVGKHISVPSKLSRQQQLDLCGQCHSTVTPALGEPFSFLPGDRFEDRFELPDPDSNGASVHTSNQVARLALSKCFTETEMACADCHNPHQAERGNHALFSERCMKCHGESDCGMSDHSIDGLDLTANCIDCHLPQMETKNLRMTVGTENVFPPLRDHHIRVDPKATAKYLSLLEPASESK